MAREIEDSISYQAESLPFGSISFGRFEAEILSWERRSSFSHNRYLEEVERYATPGSVTQKKAYFEAHFKKKPLLHPTSLGSQNEVKYQNTENGTENHTRCMEDLVDCGDDGQDEFAFYDEIPALSVEHEAAECEHEEVLRLQFSNDSTPWNDERLLDCGEAHQMHSNDPIPRDGDNIQIIAKKNYEHETGSPQELLENQETSSKFPADLENKTPALKKTERTSGEKVKGKVKKKFTKAKSKSQLPDSQISRKIPTDRSPHSSGKTSAKTLVKVEREGTKKMQPEKKSPVKTSQSSSDAKNQKMEVSEKLQVKLKQENRRSTRVHCSSKTEVKQNTVVFNFKSDERAEKRKEFYMKLEQKHDAKEADMNEIQARTQEEAKAKIKQLRKSLNFKATPMPSFYNKAAPRGLNDKKVVAMPASSSKVQSKSNFPANRTASRDKSQALSKTKQEVLSTGDPKYSHNGHCLVASDCGKKHEKSKINVLQGDGGGKKDVKVYMVRAGVGKVM